MKKAQPHAVSASTVVTRPRIVKLPAVSRKALDALQGKIEESRLTINEKPPVFLHPFSVTAAWMRNDTEVNNKLELDSYVGSSNKDDDEKNYAWHLQITPGFVNGTPPRVMVKAKNASQVSRDRVKKEREKASEETGEEAKAPEDKEIIDVPLSEFPFYEISPLGARTIGFGSQSQLTLKQGQIDFAYEPVPEAFKMMGVEESNEKRKITGAGIKFTEEIKDPDLKQIRILKAVDVVLRVERASLKYDVTKGNPFLDGYNELVTPRYARLSKTRRYATVFVDSGPFKPPIELDYEALTLAGLSDSAGDQEFDYLKLATVYFISPFGTDPKDPIGKHWQVEVKNEVFWNLCYMPAEIPPIMNPDPLRIFLPPSPGFAILGGFFNALLAPINDMVSRYMAALRSKRQKGIFWTT
jgi:hypothetical protein